MVSTHLIRVRVLYGTSWQGTLIGKRTVLKTVVAVKSDEGSSPSPVVYLRSSMDLEQSASTRLVAGSSPVGDSIMLVALI